MIKANYRNPEYFKYKYKRDPKMWTIEQLHDIWIRLSERSEKRRQKLLEYQDEIIKQITPNDRGERLIYFEANGRIFKYRFTRSRDVDSYGVSKDILDFSKDPVQARNEKIEFILNNEKVFEMGEKYRQLEKMLSYIHYNIFGLLWYEVEEFLRKEFKEVKYFKEDFIKISIGNKVYYAQIDPQHRFQYKKFHFRGEEMSIIFKIK